MGLVDLRTNLKSLRYGKDRVGGGNSNQPYVTTKIPDSFSKIGRTGGPDFLLRGGTLLPKMVVNDVSRLAQMFFDFKSPAGPLFIVKQNILSLTNVNSEVGYQPYPYTQAEGVTSILSVIGQFIKDNIALNQGIYTPLGTLAQAAGNAVGLHTNKQGLNPFANFSLGGKTTKGSLDGNSPLGLPTYLNTISTSVPSEPKSRLYGLLNKIENKQKNDDLILYSYSGGPGATLGVGKTNIVMLGDQRTGINNQKRLLLQDARSITSIMKPVSKGGEIENFLKYYIENPSPASLNYTKHNIEQRVKIGDPGRRGNRSSYSIGFRDGTNDLANKNDTESIKPNSGYGRALDQINALPIYQSKDGVTKNNIKNDLVKFRIGVIDNADPNLKTYIHFRAFIDSMSDNYSAEWQSQKYMGRGENFYKYQGFDRKISLSWTVAAQSKQELIPMYQKLNYLASVTAPSYSVGAGYMGGNLISLTIGGYLHEQVGIMTGLTLDIPTESPWEIALPDSSTPQYVPDSEGDKFREILTDPSVKELPMIIKVTGFNFIPIHNFVPKVQDNKFENGLELDKGGTFVGKYGPEQYISLTAASGNNYDGGGNNLNYIPEK